MPTLLPAVADLAAKAFDAGECGVLDERLGEADSTLSILEGVSDRFSLGVPFIGAPAPPARPPLATR